MIIDLYIRLWIIYITFQINSEYEESADKPMFVWYISFGFKHQFGIIVQKIYDNDYEWDSIHEEYNPYYPKWQIALLFGKKEKIFNKV